MSLPPDLAAIVLNIWLGAIPLVVGLLAYGLVQLARRWRPRRPRRGHLARAYFTAGRIVNLRLRPHNLGDLRVELLLRVAVGGSEIPVGAVWCIRESDAYRCSIGAEVPILLIDARPRRALPAAEWAWVEERSVAAVAVESQRVA